MGNMGGLPRLRGLRHHAPELVEIDRLGQIIERAHFERPHGVVCRAVGRDHNAALVTLLLLQPLHQLQPLPVWQAHVRHQNGKTFALQQGARLFQIGRTVHRIAAALQGNFIQRAQIGFIINDQNGCAGWMLLHIWLGSSQGW